MTTDLREIVNKPLGSFSLEKQLTYPLHLKWQKIINTVYVRSTPGCFALLLTSVHLGYTL